MGLLVECPECKKRLAATVNVCQSRSGRGCGGRIGTKVYWVSYRDPQGRKRHKRIGPSKKAAENFERKIRTDVVENKYIDKKEKPKVLILDFMEECYRPWCKTNNRGYETKRFFIDQIVSLWGDKYLTELTYEDVARHQWQMRKNKKPVMFNRVLSTLTHMYTIAIRFEKIDRSPIPDVKDLRFKEKGRLRFLTPDEVRHLLAQCNGHLRPVVVTALHTGARKGEILGMRLGVEADLQRRRICLSRTKNDEERHIPVNDTLYETLREASQGKEPGEHLFGRQDGTRYGDIRKSFKTAVRTAGILDFTFHDLRHTFASNLVMQGVDLYVVKELLGHKSIKMTEKYAHLAPEHRANAVRVLDRVFGSRSTDEEDRAAGEQSIVTSEPIAGGAE